MEMHIGLIPDGARRWAKKQSIPLLDSYIKMVSVISDSIDLFFEYGAQNVSVYLLSKENLKRKPDELNDVLNSEIILLSEMIPPLSIKHKFNTIIAGRINLLPKWANETIMKIPLSNTYLLKNLYLCMVYNPYDEIIECISKEGSQVTEQEIIRRLWVPFPLDLVIRTSGEKRLSNFLPLQSAYAELFFIPELINDLTRETLNNCLNEYQIRNRRLGK
jgi:undecaprenyl diphosphate synthase